MQLHDPDVQRGQDNLPLPGLDNNGSVAEQIWGRADLICKDLPSQLLAVDLAALSHNAGSLLRRASGKPIRVATKSVRSRDVLKAVLAQPGFAGVMAFTLAEALWLASDDAFTDILLAYPTADAGCLRELAANPTACGRVTLMVDSLEHLDFLEAVLKDSAPLVPLRLAIDLDASWRPQAGNTELAHIGVRRSPVRTAEQAVDLAREIERRGNRRAKAASTPLFALVGLMAYEAQIAGLQDAPHSPNRVNRLADAAKSLILKRIQNNSMQEISERRGQVVAALRDLTELEFVNGGGTGSLEQTSADSSVTELAAGSGLFGPTLFDGYSRFKPLPAVAFAVPVVRRPTPKIITVLGGGWIASGPAGADRVPTPVYPAGLSLVGTEGTGEVQTPLRGLATESLTLGDKVWFRHAKSGEVCEHANTLSVLHEGKVVANIPTYRGEGKAFL